MKKLQTYLKKHKKKILDYGMDSSLINKALPLQHLPGAAASP